MPMATDFTFTAENLDEEDLRVLRFSGSEGISQCFAFDLDLATLQTDIDFESVVGSPGRLTIHTPHTDRVVDGIVSRWEEVGHGRKTTYYSARLVPKVWTLTLIRQSRIFQQMSTPDILKKVLTGAGITTEGFKLSLKGTYQPRNYCVQYRETDFEFISRLMEEEGMFFFFEHTEDDGHVMIVGDSPDVHPEFPDDAIVRFREADSGMRGDEQVQHFRYARALRTGAIALKEFDFKKPSLALKSTQQASSGKDKAFESYDYPGEYHEQKLGDQLAKIRLEEERAEAYLGVGEADCRRFASGYRFTMEEHPTDALNQEYLVLRVRHQGEQPHAAMGDAAGKKEEKPVVYHAMFDCIPYATPYRPARITPRPRIDGPQTAVVTGPQGEEIHCDEHGRVKVKFHWDRLGSQDDKSSCWIRVSQAWGGSGYGALILPRVGQEVVVEFLEGDPDRPLITGRVYNGTSPPPYGLPANKTMTAIKSNSSPGGSGSNEIRFEDKAGSEEFFIHGQKDMNLLVENNRSQKIKVDEGIEIGGKRSVQVKSDQAEKVEGNDKIEIAGNRDETIGGNETDSIGGDLDVTVKGKDTLTVTGEQTIKVSGKRTDQVSGKSDLQVGSVYTIKSGSKIVEQTTQKEETIVATSKETVGAQKKITAAGQIGLESAMIKVSGAQVKVGAAGQLEVQGGVVQIKGTSVIQLDAGGSSLMIGPGIVKIQSSGVVMVNGAMIMLN